MADTTRSVSIRINAQDDTRGVFDKIEGKLDGIKQKFGRRGLLADMTELAVGGGAVAGVSFATNSLAGGIERVNEALDGLRNGTKRLEDVQLEAIRAIPIFGRLTVAIGDLVGVADAFKPLQVLRDVETPAFKAAQALEAQVRNIVGTAEGITDDSKLGLLTGVERDLAMVKSRADKTVERMGKLIDDAGQFGPEGSAEITVAATRAQIAARKAEAAAVEEIHNREADKRNEEFEAEQREVMRLWREHDEAREQNMFDAVSELQDMFDANDRRRKLEAEAEQDALRGHLDTVRRFDGRASFEAGGLLSGVRERSANEMQRQLDDKLPRAHLRVSEKMAEGINIIAQAISRPGQAII